jgi:hypothetical protein
MTTFMIVLFSILILGGVIIWLSHHIVDAIREFAPQWLTVDGKLPSMPPPPPRLRFVPRGTKAKNAAALANKKTPRRRATVRLGPEPFSASKGLRTTKRWFIAAK